MTTKFSRMTALIAVAAALLTAAPAQAALRDHGPADPVLVFPQWYRSLDGTAVGLCKSQVQSPNALAGLAPMCFALAADPAGFAGNVGPEIFYNMLNIQVGRAGNGTGGFSTRYIAALEASYIPGPAPIHGTEALFARIRVTMQIDVPGVYTVRHPFGEEVFNVAASQLGPRAVFYTADVPLGAPLDFEGALNGPIGPFISWDVLNPGETLTVGAEQFLGDPNYPHTFTGSPFGAARNNLTIIGPAGSNLDGAGNDFVVQPLGAVIGQAWTAPIATPFQVQRSTYSRNATNNVVDLWAASAPGQKLVVTGVGLPSMQLAEFPGGQYYTHIVFPQSVIPPASVTVTNLSSNPLSTLVTPVIDLLDADATYDVATGALSLIASTSDQSSPQLIVVGVGAGLMASTGLGNFTYSVALPTTVEPPRQIRIESAAGGSYLANVNTLDTGAMNGAGAPIAVNDAPVLAGAGPYQVDVGLNDTHVAGASVLVLSQPAQSTVTTVAGSTIVTITPKVGANGADSFTYALQDLGGVSNVATVSFTVPFVAAAPTTVADNTAAQTNVAKVVSVLGNDTAAVGTTIDPASIQVAIVAGQGTAVANANGTVTYTSPAGRTGVFTFTYTVANTAGTRSAPATVTMVVFGGAESISYQRVQFTVSSQRWSIVGATTYANAALTQAIATCWTGTAAASTASTFIGTAPIDGTGKFQLAPVSGFAIPVNPSSMTCKTTYGGSRSSAVSFK